MLLSRDKNVEDLLVERLLSGPASVKDLLAVAPDHTLRALYKASDKLLAAGVILKTGKKLALNEEWAREVRERILPPSAPLLGKGERAAYTFTSLEHLDAFWKGIVARLEATEGRETFFYNPHNFWAYLPERKESEDRYYRHFADARQRGYFTVGGDTLADKEFKRAYQNEFFQVDTRFLPVLNRTDHLTLIGDILIRVRLPRWIARRLDELYISGKPIEDLIPDLEKLYRSRMTTRLIIENDPLKAKKLKKMLSLNFYFWRPE